MKKQDVRLSIFCSVLVFSLLFATNAFGAIAADVDCSGDIDLKDAIVALQACVVIPPDTDLCKEYALNLDDGIGLDEALYVLQVTAGIREKATIWYKDEDEDGFSDGTRIISASRPHEDYFDESELIATSGDADDDDPDIHDDDPDIHPDSGDIEFLRLFDVTAGKSHKIKFLGAELDLENGAVHAPVKLGIKKLLEGELPALDMGMVNVTGKAKGYRFLPHGMKFDKKIRVRLPFDKGLIPEGMTENDIRTYFFDDASGRWVPLERETADSENSELTSLTDHFTDMINAVVQVPDSPQSTSFNPTQIKDIKVANPGAKVNTVEPPQANSQGDARLSYPIEIPPGRRGMQPQLAAQYSSGGGNGWMGIGWDLPEQAVSIDTRWGVPRYNPELETETYTLSGQQLTPLAHRGELVPRTSEKTFHARTEGAFQKIMRHGTGPKSYWWEVIDKNGTHFYYGGDANGQVTDATLADDAGNIAKWALRLVRDSNGNTMRYEYAIQEDTGLGDGTQGELMGSELYLKDIFYTGHGSQDGPFRVTFVRDRELGEVRRPDVMIDARLGLKRHRSGNFMWRQKA